LLWEDFGHVLGNNVQETDQISFQSDQNDMLSRRQHSLLSANLQRLFKLKEDN